MGRCAWLAAWALALPVHDTQCGAKFFRHHPALTRALEQPFSSRWAFDVELIGRLVYAPRPLEPLPIESFLEVPLKVWIDKPGSKVSLWGGMMAFADLVRIARALREHPEFDPRRGEK